MVEKDGDDVSSFKSKNNLFSVEVDGYDETVKTQYFSENENKDHTDE